MDTNTGEFVDDSRAESWMQRIDVGEVIKIKGEELDVLRIDERTIVLKLLNASDRMNFSYEHLAVAESKRQRENMLKRQKN